MGGLICFGIQVRFGGVRSGTNGQERILKMFLVQNRFIKTWGQKPKPETSHQINVSQNNSRASVLILRHKFALLSLS